MTRLQERYKDAYTVASWWIGSGKLIKFIGVILGALLAVAGLVCFFAGNAMSFVLGVVFIVTAGAVVLIGLNAGIITAAVGQLILARVDTAVNTFEGVSPEDKARICGY